MSFYIALYYLIVIKFPDFFCRKHGYRRNKLGVGSPYGFTNTMQWVVILIGILGTCMPASPARPASASNLDSATLHAGCSASLLDSCASFV